MRRAILGMALIGAVSIGAASIRVAGQSTVHFTIDANEDVRPISRLIYGVNQSTSGPIENFTFTRLGGNRLTAWNWVTNASNAGKDYRFQSDDYLAKGSTPGAVVMPTLSAAYAANADALLTVPMNGYVAADEDGPVDIKDLDHLAKRFKREEPAKGAAFSIAPDPNAAIVYQDEFVNWVKANYAYGESDANRRIFFQLDNEPDIWAASHPEVHAAKLTYAELMEKTIAYAKAIKNVEPGTFVYGPVNYGWGGMVDLQQAPDANGRDFESFYLRSLAEAEKAGGKRLVDVLDIHWYPEATGGGVRITEPGATEALVAARLQAPRSLWDPTYTETSWITRSSTHGPIDLIPMLQKKIAANYPGTKLSISEYNYGGGDDISGGIAEADVLGIFGRSGVFSANEWPLTGNEGFIAGGFAMFRDFDGHMGAFGDTSISAVTDDAADTSVYASIDSANPDRMIVVAINKSANAVATNLQLKNSKSFTRAEVFMLTRAHAGPVSGGALTVDETGQCRYEMPAYSVSTLRFVGGRP